jgi:hypothetical protein
MRKAAGTSNAGEFGVARVRGSTHRIGADERVMPRVFVGQVASALHQRSGAEVAPESHLPTWAVTRHGDASIVLASAVPALMPSATAARCASPRRPLLRPARPGTPHAVPVCWPRELGDGPCLTRGRRPLIPGAPEQRFAGALALIRRENCGIKSSPQRFHRAVPENCAPQVVDR